LHQIPAVSNAAALIFSDLARNGTSFWIIAGAQTSIPNFNNLNFGFQIPIPNTFEETQLEYNEGFGLFETGNEMRAFFKSLPSMLSPSGAISNNSGLRPMFYKKQNGITTTQPIFAFNPEGSGNFGKYAILAGEGIWRWRVFDYKLHDNHQLFNELINKIVQLLIKKDNKERFKIITKKIFSENEHVFFEAEAYNESYELVNKNDVVMDILDSINKKIAYTFDKNNKSYVLNVGNFPVGDYQYKASTVIEDKKFEKSGRFSVIPVHVEQENTVANHQMLYQLAYKTGGKLIYPNQIASLQQELNKNKTINAVSFANKSLEEFINLKWLFAWIVLLIAVEWFLRKFLGAY